MEKLERFYLSQLLPAVPNAIVGIIAQYVHDPYIFQIDLSNYYQKKLCPGCCGNTPHIPKCDQYFNSEVVQNYQEYFRKISSQYFGKLSLPVCFPCWHDNCEMCNECGVPIYIGFSGDFVLKTILGKTTIAKESVSDHICIYCYEKNKNL
jgi:hypothetical protein